MPMTHKYGRKRDVTKQSNNTLISKRNSFINKSNDFVFASLIEARLNITLNIIDMPAIIPPKIAPRIPGVLVSRSPKAALLFEAQKRLTKNIKSIIKHVLIIYSTSSGEL